MKLALYCDFVSEEIRPLQLVIRFDPGEPNWSDILYLPLRGPFEPFEPEGFEDRIVASVLLEDLVLKRDDEEELGILLPNLARRHPAADITVLVVQIADAEEVLGVKWGDRLLR
ncbi:MULTISPECIES: hypothetical protein [Paenibacillus]|uniref:hypothetical protein n=1 Tax=Paenibacillus TaxID=44249 RepID=UPI002FE2BBB0